MRLPHPRFVLLLNGLLDLGAWPARDLILRENWLRDFFPDPSGGDPPSKLLTTLPSLEAESGAATVDMAAMLLVSVGLLRILSSVYFRHGAALPLACISYVGECVPFSVLVLLGKIDPRNALPPIIVPLIAMSYLIAQRSKFGTSAAGEKDQADLLELAKATLRNSPAFVAKLLLIFGLAAAFVRHIGAPLIGIHNAGGFCSEQSRTRFADNLRERGVDLRGKSALFVVSTWSALGARASSSHGIEPDPEFAGWRYMGWKRSTGCHIQEFAHPALIFADLGMRVDFASPSGGEAPIDRMDRFTDNTLLADWASDRYFAGDHNLSSKMARTHKLADVDLSSYDIVSMTGGWGPAFELPRHEPLGQQLVKAFHSGRTVLGGICHGVLGFRTAVDPESGKNIAAGRRCTGVTDKFSKEMKLWPIPGMYHPEHTLRREVNCDFRADYAGPGQLFQELLAGSDLNMSVTSDGPFVFGQNQNVGCRYAMELVETMVRLQE